MPSVRKVVDAGSAERKYIENGLRNGTITRQMVGLSEILIEPEKYQARVPMDGKHYDMTHVKRLAAIRESNGDEPLAPAVVFWDPKRKKHIMADGFHRHREAQLRRDVNLSCYVVKTEEPGRGGA